MDLTVKGHLLARNFISNFSYNQTYHILAAIVQSADTIAFYHLQNHPPAFQEIFQGTSKPAGKKSSLAWSNDGNYLALGSANLELWKLDANKIVPVRTFNDDFVDIKVIQWSPDSVWIAYGGLSKKNTVKIKNIQSGVTQEIFIPVVVCGISYDPFGKYLLLLLRNNILYLYNSSSLNKIKEVPLSPNAKPSQNANTVKELRRMGWSPDFNYLVTPSLDDSKIAMAFNLARGTNFKIKQAFLGHVSSVSCCRFNPNLYQFEGDVTSIVALGDSHGVVSVWRLGKKIYGQPLILLNSSPEYHQVVQEVEWSEGGDVLLVNCMKRYVSVYTFGKQKFGRQLSQQEKNNIIEESYGVTSVTEINQKQLEVFSMQSIQPKQTNQPSSASVDWSHPTQPAEKKSLFTSDHLNTALTGKVEYVRVNQQVTLKDKNNRKKIQPAILIRKDELDKSKANIQNNPILAGTMTAYSTIASFKPLKLKPIRCEWTIFKTSTKGYLQLKKLQGFTICKIYQQRQGDKVLATERVLTGTVDWLQIVQNKIYLLNMGNLYIFGSTLNLIDLPYTIGDVHRISVNQMGDIYYVSTAGLIKGFNHQAKTCYTPVPVVLQSLIQAIKWHPPAEQNVENSDEKGQQFQSIVQDMSVQSNHNLYLTLYFTRHRYFYCRNTNCWISLELSSGLLQHGHSLRIGEHQDRLASDFLRSLTARFFPNNTLSTQTPLQQFESNMIYYRYHEPNSELYRQNILSYLRELKVRNHPSKLRDEIVKYLVNKESGYYEDDEWLRRKVREMGGSVVEEFVLFGQL